MQTIIVPDRYEVLARKVPQASISQLVVRIPQTLKQFDEVFKVMDSAGRGALVVLRGVSGSGKSTFLHTLKIFKKDVETISIESGVSIKLALTLQQMRQHTVYSFLRSAKLHSPSQIVSSKLGCMKLMRFCVLLQGRNH